VWFALSFQCWIFPWSVCYWLGDGKYLSLFFKILFFFQKWNARKFLLILDVSKKNLRNLQKLKHLNYWQRKWKKNPWLRYMHIQKLFSSYHRKLCLIFFKGTENFKMRTWMRTLIYLQNCRFEFKVEGSFHRDTLYLDTILY